MNFNKLVSLRNIAMNVGAYEVFMVIYTHFWIEMEGLQMIILRFSAKDWSRSPISKDLTCVLICITTRGRKQ